MEVHQSVPLQKQFLSHAYLRVFFFQKLLQKSQLGFIPGFLHEYFCEFIWNSFQRCPREFRDFSWNFLIVSSTNSPCDFCSDSIKNSSKKSFTECSKYIFADFSRNTLKTVIFFLRNSHGIYPIYFRKIVLPSIILPPFHQEILLGVRFET